MPAKHEAEAASVEAPVLVEAVEIESDSMPEQLPSTGSWMPTIGLLGLFSIGMAGTLRLAADRKK
jgi:LPXTG-motif cell wall-anchored protein